MIRAAYSVIGIILLVLAFSLFMFACGCEITVKLIVGTIADAIFLGSIGLLTSAVTGNLSRVFYDAALVLYAEYYNEKQAWKLLSVCNDEREL